MVTLKFLCLLRYTGAGDLPIAVGGHSNWARVTVLGTAIPEEKERYCICGTNILF